MLKLRARFDPHGVLAWLTALELGVDVVVLDAAEINHCDFYGLRKMGGSAGGIGRKLISDGLIVSREIEQVPAANRGECSRSARGSARNNAPGFVCRGHVDTSYVDTSVGDELPLWGGLSPRFPDTNEPHGPHRFCDGHHIIFDCRELVIGNTAGRRWLSLNWQYELPKDWGTTMSIFTNHTSRVDIEARIAERRRADSGNDLRGDYHEPFGKAEARAEAAKWLCQV